MTSRDSVAGYWRLIEIETLPVEPGMDDGGMHDMGEGFSTEPHGPWIAAFVHLRADGGVAGDFLGEESGRWGLEEGELVIELEGAQFALVDELLERNEFDEEHGREMVFRYEKDETVTDAKSKKLSAKLKKKIQRMWDTYCECDHLGDEEVKEVLEEGGAAAAAYMESDESETYLLGSAMSNSNWDLAALMMDAGAVPTAETSEMAGHWEKYGEEGDSKQAVIDRLRGFGGG